MREGIYYIKTGRLWHKFYHGHELRDMAEHLLYVNGRRVYKYLGNDVGIEGTITRKCYIYDHLSGQKRYYDRKMECFI